MYLDILKISDTLLILRVYYSESVASVISIWIQFYGPPEIIQTVHSGEFKGAREILLRQWGIKIKHAKLQTPNVQGLVEQANGVVQNRITKWKMENGKWIYRMQFGFT